jgi:hypothetical protein
MTLKMAVFTPIPSARVSTATAVKLGRFNRLLIPYRISLNSISIASNPSAASGSEISDFRSQIRAFLIHI